MTPPIVSRLILAPVENAAPLPAAQIPPCRALPLAIHVIGLPY
jgi:hypothetical protein